MEKYVKVDTLLKKLNDLEDYYKYGNEGMIAPRTMINQFSNIILDCPLEAVIQATSRNSGGIIDKFGDKSIKRKVLKESGESKE